VIALYFVADFLADTDIIAGIEPWDVGLGLKMKLIHPPPPLPLVSLNGVRETHHPNHIG
jgi:hypothetical protein